MNFKDLLPKNIPFLSGGSKDLEYFFALNIGSAELTAAVWGIDGNHLRIINTVNMPVGRDDDLVEAGNRVLDEVLGNFQPEPEKILFGVPDNWLQDDNLKDTHLNFLKHLTKELSVEPIAYVSTSHAITHLLQKQTGVPTTAILVEVANPLNVTIVKGGKILGSKAVKRTHDLPVDIEKALHTFPEIEVMPSKIALYGSGDINKFKDEVQSYNWMNSLPFLHLPKVESLEEGVAVKAISLAGASEINPDVSYPHHGVPEVARPNSPTHSMHSEPVHHRGGAPEGAAAGGFVAGDVANVARVEDEEAAVEDYSEPEPEYAAGVAEFQQEKRQQMALRGHQPRGVEEYYQGGVAHHREVNPIFNRIKAKLSWPLVFLRSKGINLRLPGGSGARKYLIPGVILIALLVGFLFLPKATVKIFIDPKILEKDAQVVADPSATTVDETQKIIPGKIIETDIQGNSRGSATGKKQVGDSAKGNVIIYNKSSSSKSFPAGTILQGPNNLNFTLVSATDNIASPSADDGTWGKATASVVAAQIGPDSNLPANTQLTVQGQPGSSFAAKVDSGLSGGTSKDVQVVTADDQKRALAALASDLRNQAQGKLQGKLTGDQKILSEALDEKITSTSYTKKVGDQASDFGLDMTIHYKGTAYSDGDLKSIVGKLVETNVPPGFELNLAQTETQADVSKLEKDGKLVFLAKFKAKLMPKIDTDKIKGEIKGKSISQAGDIIKGVENVIGSDIQVKPSLPGPLQMLPLISSHINIIVTTK